MRVYCSAERITATAEIQGEHGGAHPRDWSELQEVAFRTLYEAAFAAARVGSGTKLLDVGCGAGLACQVAQLSEAKVSGLDAAAAMVEIAKSRCPGADIRVGEIEALPFGDCAFDVVTGFNSFQYAAADRSRRGHAADKLKEPLCLLSWGSGRPVRMVVRCSCMTDGEDQDRL